MAADSQILLQPTEEAQQHRKSRSNATDPSNSSTPSTRAHHAYNWRVTGKQGGCFSHLSPLFSSCGKFLFLTVGCEARVHSTATGDLLQPLLPEATTRPIVSLFLDPSNAYRLAGVYQDGSISVWDYTDGALLKQLHLTDQRTVVAATLNGSLLLVSDGKHVFSAEWSTKTATLPTTQVADMKACLGLSSAPGLCFAWGDNKVNVFPIQKEKLGQYEQYVLASPATAFAADATHFAVSDDAGAIYLYHHAARNLALPPRKLHWHAQACTTLQFALDGAYLLSGGHEGVLVLWQLATSGKQFLPRVGTAIRAIGYAVKLEENTVKVLSASTLLATCDIAGPKRASVMCSHGEEVMMAAGGQVQTWHSQMATATGLLNATAQSFAGATQVGKASIPVPEPEITHMAVSPADCWTTPFEEAADLGYTKPHDQVSLKFWQRHAGSWRLSTRVDAPHGVARLTTIQALGGDVFVTAGEDQAVKFWNKNSVRSSDDAAQAYKCTRVLRFAQPSLMHERAPALRLAVSGDASLLALSGPPAPHTTDASVLLVDPATRQICATLAGLGLGTLLDLGFAGDYLILVGQYRLVCWCVAASQVVYALRWPERTFRATLTCPIPTPISDATTKVAHFCIATQESKQATGASLKTISEGSHKLFIFGTHAAKPVFREKCPFKTLAVGALTDGFVVLDETLVLRRIGAGPAKDADVALTHDSSALTVTSGISKDGQVRVLTSQAVETLMPVATANGAGASLASLEQCMAGLGLFLLGAPSPATS
ncbi:WD40-repeat-containing domain protein [Protomyces lactucae-debilis]|uniref:WD40-repeat-containing domain protein n=1 Tax=Protomyces lactucae-debilis TaxID=2754530 RepID=A0A1Y2F215_PROLT|nr:WD40-repeat-containing domain protein [Protomyces lactucae-debilis]ORY76995.1 WD40-repeat-containing domain protein [Protomyces lactucae-debilis]